MHGWWSASSPVVSRLRVAVCLLVCCSLPAATLERLTLDDMTGKATAVVRGIVTGSSTSMVGSTVYTWYRVQVSEVWKGPVQNTVTVMMPGGVANGVRQSFAGVPHLNIGGEYVMFLWTGKSGNTQLIGLTQGLFDVSVDADGSPVASRGASSELMLDANGKAVQDQAVRMSLKSMSSHIRGTGSVR